MQIDSSSFKKLSQKEKERRCKEDLCLYCSEKNHQAQDCPINVSALKLHKVQNVLINSKSKVADVELENKDVHP